MIWDVRQRLAGTPIEPAFGPGLLVTLIGSGIFLVGKLSNTLILQGVALVTTLLGLAWLILGTRHFKLLVVPIGYLCFMFSFFEELLGSFSLTLQRLTAQLSAILLKLFGMPVFVSGEYIQLPHITLEVAKVCNGVNHIIALVALSIPVAVKSFTTTPRRVALVVIAFLTGLFANGVRVALIGWWTIDHHQDSIHGPFEFLYVSFILFFGLLIIGGVSYFSAHPRRFLKNPKGWMMKPAPGTVVGASAS